MYSPETSLSLLQAMVDMDNQGAWSRFDHIYRPLIRRWIGRYIRDDAVMDDVVQETMTNLIRGLPRFEHNQRPGAFRAWLKVVTVNQIRRYWRANNRWPFDGPDELAEVVSPDGDLSRQWDQEHDLHVLGKLVDRVRVEFSQSTWRAFRAVVLRGETPQEVADRLGMTVNAVYVARSRFLQRLRQEGRGLLDY